MTVPSPLAYLPTLPTDRSPGIGCIGAGFIMADCQLVAYRASGFNPVALYSRTRSTAQAVADRHQISQVYDDYTKLIANPAIEVLDIAVPPNVQIDVVREAVKHKHIRGILAQKPLGMNLPQAQEIVRLCGDAGIRLVVNQNMRYDQSVRAMKHLLDRGDLGRPIFGSIDMRAIPHWMPWQKDMGFVTLRTMSIHHLDTFRYWFGNPRRVFCSVTEDPRTARQFDHTDGVALYILEYDNGARASAWDDVWAGPAREGAEADISINWRVEGTDGMARGIIGWPEYPTPTPSTLDYTTTLHPGAWHQPRWPEVWFPDAFAGPMAELLVALETNTEAPMSGHDNLYTMALVDACYRSYQEHRAVEIEEMFG
jgi:predicted dehydrogenase